MDFRFNNIIFSSNFDSGNLLNVEKISTNSSDDGTNNNNLSSSVGDVLKPDYEFNVWTKPDCYGTEFENGNRTWFFFSVRGYSPGRVMKITIKNLNRQQRLYSQGYNPLYKTEMLSGQEIQKWTRVRLRPTWENTETNFQLSFVHRLPEQRLTVTYFAFCYPWTYGQCQNQLKDLDEKFENISNSSYNDLLMCSKRAIYYKRELITHSLDGRRVDLLTITDLEGLLNEHEDMFDQRLFPEKNSRPFKFENKRVFVLTSRVHPGETPSSHVFNGFLEFIIRPNDPRAIQLRKQFIFKMIPLLNPDGVYRGHYRTDSRGVNLNRVYLCPDYKLHPTIYAAKSILVYHHISNSLEQPSKITCLLTQVFKDIAETRSAGYCNVSNIFDSNTNIIAQAMVNANSSTTGPYHFDTYFQNDANQNETVNNPTQTFNTKMFVEDIFKDAPSKNFPEECSVNEETSINHHDNQYNQHHTKSQQESKFKYPRSIDFFSPDVPLELQQSLINDKTLQSNGENAVDTPVENYSEKQFTDTFIEVLVEMEKNQPLTNNKSIEAVISDPSLDNSTKTPLNEFQNPKLTSKRPIQEKSLVRESVRTNSPPISSAPPQVFQTPKTSQEPPSLQEAVNEKYSDLYYPETDEDSSLSKEYKKTNPTKSRKESRNSSMIPVPLKPAIVSMRFGNNASSGNSLKSNNSPRNSPTGATIAISSRMTNSQMQYSTKSAKKVSIDPVQLARFKKQLQIRYRSEPKLGNEGSDDDDSDCYNKGGDIKLYGAQSVINCLHLSSSDLLTISPHTTGVAFYVDLHGHCSKRGCFMYGNCMDNEFDMILNLLYAKFISLNSANFDFAGCNFSLKNMYAKDKRDGTTKEGAGRVAIRKHLGLIHSYTLECNYNTGRIINTVPPPTKDDGKCSPPMIESNSALPPRYTPAHYEDVGKAVAIAALDMTQSNPWSRLCNSEFGSFNGIRENIRKFVHSSTRLHCRVHHQQVASSSSSGTGGVNGLRARLANSIRPNNLPTTIQATYKPIATTGVSNYHSGGLRTSNSYDLSTNKSTITSTTTTTTTSTSIKHHSLPLNTPGHSYPSRRLLQQQRTPPNSKQRSPSYSKHSGSQQRSPSSFKQQQQQQQHHLYQPHHLSQTPTMSLTKQKIVNSLASILPLNNHHSIPPPLFQRTVSSLVINEDKVKEVNHQEEMFDMKDTGNSDSKPFSITSVHARSQININNDGSDSVNTIKKPDNNLISCDSLNILSKHPTNNNTNNNYHEDHYKHNHQLNRRYSIPGSCLSPCNSIHAVIDSTSFIESCKMHELRQILAEDQTSRPLHPNNANSLILTPLKHCPSLIKENSQNSNMSLLNNSSMLLHSDNSLCDRKSTSNSPKSTSVKSHSSDNINCS